MDTNFTLLKRSQKYQDQDPDHIFRLQLLKRRLGILPVQTIYNKAESFTRTRAGNWNWNRVRTWTLNRTRTGTEV